VFPLFELVHGFVHASMLLKFVFSKVSLYFQFSPLLLMNRLGSTCSSGNCKAPSHEEQLLCIHCFIHWRVRTISFEGLVSGNYVLVYLFIYFKINSIIVECYKMWLKRQAN
jgi:hypothetical protein